jgi:hypothetical protein
LQFFVLEYVHFLGTLFDSGACHLLSHHLLEGTVIRGLSELEDFLWLGSLSLNLCSSESLNVGFRQHTCFVRLPLNVVKFMESLKFSKDLGSIGSENLESIVNLETLIEDRGQDVSATG